MLNPDTISSIRVILDRALKAGLVEYKEIVSFGRIVLALDVEQKLWEEAHPGQNDTSQLITGSNGSAAQETAPAEG